MNFTKMHGLGNDYLYVYSDTEPETPEALSIKLSERHFAAGSDGMIWILPSTIADFKMRIFNADGSEAKMCGNGIRCVGKYVYDKGYTAKTTLEIETLSGIKTLKLTVNGGKVSLVEVDMGKAVVSQAMTLNVCEHNIRCIPVSVGNPHAVIFTDDAENAPLTTVGAALEHHEAFPEGVNAEFASVISENRLRMRVWERGSGITMACGTGSCATAVAAVSEGLVNAENDIEIVLDGGVLRIRVAEDGSVKMTGPAEMVYDAQTVDGFLPKDE